MCGQYRYSLLRLMRWKDTFAKVHYQIRDDGDVLVKQGLMRCQKQAGLGNLPRETRLGDYPLK